MLMKDRLQHVSWAPLVGRVLMGGLFFIAGLRKVTDLSGPAGMIEGLGLPIPMVLAIVVVIVEIGAGALLIAGYHAKLAAGALAVFTLLTLVFVHNSLDDEMLTKNLAIIGGLLYVIAYGAGPFALGGTGKGAPQEPQAAQQR